MPFGPWPGAGGGGGGGGAGPLDRFERYGDQLMIVNNADWSVNLNAETDSDSINAAWKVAKFPNNDDSGRGYRRRVRLTATNIKFEFVLRGDGTAANDTDFEIHFRRIVQSPAAAVGGWTILALAAMLIPANSFHLQFSETFVIGAGAGEIPLILGFQYEWEVVRKGVLDAYQGVVRLGEYGMEQTV